MTDARFDGAIWSGLERRLTGVEAFIPDAPPWHPSTAAELTGTVRLGSAFGRSSGASWSRRRRLVQVLVVVAALIGRSLISLLFAMSVPYLMLAPQ